VAASDQFSRPDVEVDVDLLPHDFVIMQVKNHANVNYTELTSLPVGSLLQQHSLNHALFDCKQYSHPVSFADVAAKPARASASR